MSCEETLHALRTANEALEQLPDPVPRRNKRRGSSGGSSSNGTASEQQDHQQQQLPMGKLPLDPTPASAKKNGASPGEDHAGPHDASGAAEGRSSVGGSNGAVRLDSTTPKGLAALQEEYEEVADGRRAAASSNGSADGSMDEPGRSGGMAAVQSGVGNALLQARDAVTAGTTAVAERTRNGAFLHLSLFVSSVILP
jgi:hypothetical protein